MKHKVIVCDLDGTLAPSKAPLEKEMAETLDQVLGAFRMAVISGASFEQFERQFLSHLNLPEAKLRNLHLFPINGAEYYAYDNGWNIIYSEPLSDEEKKEIYLAFGKAIPESGVDVEDPYGAIDILEDRRGQVTFSGRGQEAPLEVKEAWDPDENKRKKIVAILETLIPQFEIRIGGATSIDITRKGISKAYAIGKIEEHLKVAKKDIIFLGDALFPGGNDESAKETGIECIQVSGPEETRKILINMLAE